jgi:hypothetical protein
VVASSLLYARPARAQDNGDEILGGVTNQQSQPDAPDAADTPTTVSTQAGQTKWDDPKVPPAHVQVGIYVLNVSSFSLATGQFTIDFYLDLTSADVDPVTKKPIPFGTLSPEFMNGRAANKTLVLPDSSDKKALMNATEQVWRIQALLQTNIDLRGFPWDKHALPIVLEDTNRTTSNDDSSRGLVYQFDPVQSGIDPSVSIVGWRLDGFTAEEADHFYSVPTGLPTMVRDPATGRATYDVDTSTNPVYLQRAPYDPTGKANPARTVFAASDGSPGAEHYSQLRYAVNIGRLYFIATIKTFLPVVCFVIIILLSLLCGVDKLDQRQTMNTTMLLASILYHINLTNQLPQVPYLTRADRVMIATYTTVAFNLFLTVFMVRYAAWRELRDAKLAALAEAAKPKPPPKVEKEGEKAEKKAEKKPDEKDKKKEEKKDTKVKPPPNPILVKWRHRSWVMVPLFAALAYTVAVISPVK